MKSRQILIAVVILATMCHSAAAQKKRKIRAAVPPVQGVLVGTNDQSNAVLSELVALQPQMPLGPQDVLKSYEIAMTMLADKTSNDFSFIVQAQERNQISREQAEYLLQERYQVAMMQYQVLSSLHDVLKHDIDEARQQTQSSLNTASADTVPTVPFPGRSSESR